MPYKNVVLDSHLSPDGKIHIFVIQEDAVSLNDFRVICDAGSDEATSRLIRNSLNASETV